MATDLLHGDKKVTGNMTSGGTESDWQAPWTPASDGPHAVQACKWEMSCLPVPEDIIYRKLYSGDARPVDTPAS